MKKIVPESATLISADATKVFEGVIFDVYQWQQAMYDGSMATFEMLRRPDTMQIVAIKDDQVVMVREEQPNKKLRIDFPSGRDDHADESWLQAAQRELLEETGMRFKSWKLVFVQQPLGKIEQFVAWFVATDFESQQPQQLDAGEKIEVVLVPFETMRANIFDPHDQATRYAATLFYDVKTLDQLLALPEFTGVEIDR